MAKVLEDAARNSQMEVLQVLTPIFLESWFEYGANNEAQPDFPEAGVELKVTPYIRTVNGIRAKERLVCNIINYKCSVVHN